MKRTKVSFKDTGQRDGSRRYSEQKNPSYHHHYDRLLSNSHILNPDSSRGRESNWSQSLSRANGELMRLVGGSGRDGRFYIQGNNVFHLASIPSAKEQLVRIHQRFRLWQRDQIRSGKALEPPKNWPLDLLKKRLEWEARLDVRKREAVKVQDRIEELSKTKDKPILPRGPLLQGRLPGNNLTGPYSIDGQKISFDSKGRPFIDCSESPYNGMYLTNYRSICKKWQEKVQKLIREYNKGREKEYENSKYTPPRARLFNLNIETLGLSKDDFPAIPDD